MRTVPAAAARTGSPVRPSMSRPSWKPYLVRRWPKNWVIGPRNGHAQIGGVSVDTGPGPTGTCKSGPSVMVGVERLLASTAIRAKVRSGMGTGRARVGAGREAGSDKRPTIKMRTTTRAAASATRRKRLDRSGLGPRQETAACALISIRERHAGAAKLARLPDLVDQAEPQGFIGVEPPVLARPLVLELTAGHLRATDEDAQDALLNLLHPSHRVLDLADLAADTKGGLVDEQPRLGAHHASVPSLEQD